MVGFEMRRCLKRLASVVLRHPTWLAINVAADCGKGPGQAGYAMMVEIDGVAGQSIGYEQALSGF